MKNIMLDLETMGTGPDGAIISIGAVYFDKTGLGEQFYEKISLESAVKAGLKIDASTVLWWMQQSEEARGEFKDNDKAPSLGDVLFKFRNFIGANHVTLWGNGSTFDNIILRSAYRAVKKDAPWYYSKDLCFRTLKAIAPQVPRPEDNNAKHNALADAIWQAEYAVKIFNALGIDI